MPTTTTIVPSLLPLTPFQQDLVDANMGLVGLCLKRLKVRPQFRQDARSEGILGLIAAAKAYNEDVAKFSTFAVICIQRKMWAAVEHECSRQHVSVSNDEHNGFEEKEARDEVPIEAFEMWEKMMTKLPAKQVSVIRMKLVDDMGWREIGDALGVSRQSAYNWFEQGIASLQEM